MIEFGGWFKDRKNLSAIKTACCLLFEQKCAQFLYVIGFVSKNREA